MEQVKELINSLTWENWCIAILYLDSNTDMDSTDITMFIWGCLHYKQDELSIKQDSNGWYKLLNNYRLLKNIPYNVNGMTWVDVRNSVGNSVGIYLDRINTIVRYNTNNQKYLEFKW